jgi:hypothetical protein
MGETAARSTWVYSSMVRRDDPNLMFAVPQGEFLLAWLAQREGVENCEESGIQRNKPAHVAAQP